MRDRPDLHLKGFQFSELFHASSLKLLDNQFLEALKQHQSSLYHDLCRYRHEALPQEETDAVLMDVGIFLEQFMADLFGIQEAVHKQRAMQRAEHPLFVFKDTYVKKEARRRTDLSALMPFEALTDWLMEQIDIQDGDMEQAVAALGHAFLKDADHQSIEKLIQWCAWALYSPEGQAMVQGWVIFQLPKKQVMDDLVPHQKNPASPWGALVSQERRIREGFHLTDQRMSQRAVANQVHYCIDCHQHAGDFCSRGFPVKKSDPDAGLRRNALGQVLTGCPLDEKISQMHGLKREGYSIAALAMVMVDNPMCPLTGHRICNDCMKSCIYQKQEPVNVPEIETRVLTDVLDLPWGVEVYDLLTRWNPLRSTQWVAEPYNGKKVFIAGMGPAGITLAHHLLMSGCAVVGIDGQKILPMAVDQPIYRYQDLVETLEDRVVLGLGGVSEYGITVRWDKNFLKLVAISLLRRPYFQVWGHIRFGGTVTIDDVWSLGFDHLAIAVGAGLPKALPIPGSLAPGVRQASDFLMALHLTGVVKKQSLSNLQVRLPAVVIGGGLTGVDTATEVRAYYIKHIQKIRDRYDRLVAFHGVARVRGMYDAYELEILDEWLAHAHAVREGHDVQALIESWGGVHIVYRGSLQASPAYRLNHEELTSALQEGIGYIEKATPLRILLDDHGHAAYLECRMATGETERLVSLPARSVFVATGAVPNIAYGFEHAGTLNRRGFQYVTYQQHQGTLIENAEVTHCKASPIGMLTSYQKAGHRVSVLGDTHPAFHGSVVKAMASAKHAYPQILEACDRAASKADYPDFAHRIQQQFTAHVHAIKPIKAGVVDLIIRAPQIAKKHQPGQFYRVQPQDRSHYQNGVLIDQAEAVALIGWKSGEDTLVFPLDTRKANQRLLSLLSVHQPIGFMGPTGVRTQIPKEKADLLLMGDQSSIPYICAVGPALRANGSRVLCVLHVPNAQAIHHEGLLQDSADELLVTMGSDSWEHRLTECLESLSGSWQDIDRVYVHGDSHFIRRVKSARTTCLANHLKKAQWVASVYGPMQCMLKGVCAQCLQWQIDPKTGARTKAVFACSWQDQPMDIIDIGNIDERLAQNRVQERLTDLWLHTLLDDNNFVRETNT